MVNKTPDNGIILARSICDSCGKYSGPILTLPELRDRQDFLRENILPDGIERQMIFQDIRTAEKKISQIDIEIYRLQQQREVLQDFVNREKSLFAPIRTLPDDVLRHLFVTCQRYSGNEGFIDVCDRKQAFVSTIMHVCAHWRRIAFSSPELWSRISVLNYSPEPELNGFQIDPFFDECILYSGEMPLCMRIPTYLGDSCRQSISRCSYRWKEIDVFDAEGFTDITDCIGPDLVLRSLERLSFRYEYDSAIESTNTINPSPILSYFHIEGTHSRGLIEISFKSAPSLRTLCIEYIRRPMSIFIDLPWDQITSFDSNLNEYDKNELGLLLKSMPNLVSFKLEGETNMAETVTLPSLKMLMLPCEMDVDNMVVLDAFTIPHIETLHLGLETDPSSVFRFLTRSCCPLLDLKLTRTFLNRDCMEICSGSLRTVKTLCLAFPDPQWNDILVLTQEDRRSGVAFPQLESLEMRRVVLEKDRKFSDVVEPVVHMLKSRIAPTQESLGSEIDSTLCSLEQVTIIFTEYLTREEKIAFYKLNRADLVRESGVKVNIAHKKDDCFIIRNGVAVDEEMTESEKSSSSYEVYRLG